MSEAWDASFDRACAACVERLVAAERSSAEQREAWKKLVIDLAPRIENWARRSPLLRRCDLASDDDARAVLVAVLDRMSRDDFENLRRFVHRRVEPSDDDREADAIEALTRFVSASDGAEGENPHLEGTPFRGWVLNLVRYAAKDHVKQRLGWARPDGQNGTKRDVNTGAARLDEAPESSERPPLTDLLSMRAVMDEIRAHVATFPPPMQQALELWTTGAHFEEISDRLGLQSPDRARALVRAGQARLRERFRGKWPTLFGE